MTCGWCLTSNCEDCIIEIKYFEKTWKCSCVKCASTKTETKDDNVGTQEVAPPEG